MASPIVTVLTQGWRGGGQWGGRDEDKGSSAEPQRCRCLDVNQREGDLSSTPPPKQKGSGKEGNKAKILRARRERDPSVASLAPWGAPVRAM